MTNIAVRIITLTADRLFITDAIVVDRLWPESQQPEKKCLTVQRHLRHLVESGYAIRVKPGLWKITEAGMRAAKTASQTDRPTMMRIVR